MNMNAVMGNVKTFLKNNYFTFIVFFVVLLGFILRYFHTKVGLPYLYNWDEPQTASTALQMMKTGDFNPHFFNYGSMMIYSNLIVDILHYFSLMGHPESAESFLRNLHDITINKNTGWHWTISHPSFYHWNRVLTAILGTGTILLVYLTGKHVYNKWVGLISALFLAILPFHISQSAWITTDAPVAFFVSAVVLFSVLFIKYQKPAHLIWSLVFVGISIATKYNAALSVLIPLIALVVVFFMDKQRPVKMYLWFLVPLIPIGIFLIIMPYAIIDLTTFLKHVGSEVTHYKIRGHGDATSVPGWEHFSFQMNQFYRQIGLISTLFIIVGLIGTMLRPLFGFVLILPAIYILYMTGMTVNFHRNFVQVYPFLALLYGAGAYYLYYVASKAQERFLPNKRMLAQVVVLTIFLAILAPQAYTSVDKAHVTYHSKDTRTNAITQINEIKNVKKIVIAEEIKIHAQDLKKLKLPYKVLPLLKMPSQNNIEGVIFVVPSNVTSFNVKRDESKLQPLKQLIASIEKSKTVGQIGGNRGTRIDIFSVNPGLIFVKELPFIPLKINLEKPYTITFDECAFSKPYKGNPLGMYWNGTVSTATYELKKGNYDFTVNAKGTPYAKKYAELKIEISYNEKDKKTVIAEKIVETNSEFKDYIIPFQTNTDSNISFSVSFINDGGNPATKEDRNAYLKSLVVKER